MSLNDLPDALLGLVLAHAGVWEGRATADTGCFSAAHCRGLAQAAHRAASRDPARRCRRRPPAPAAHRRPAVTLVCKRWRSVFYGEPQLWRGLRIQARPFPAHPRDLEGEARWLEGHALLMDRVAPLVQWATLLDGGSRNPLQLAPLLQHLQPTLERLTVELYRCTREAVQAMERLTQLTCLDIQSRALRCRQIACAPPHAWRSCPPSCRACATWRSAPPSCRPPRLRASCACSS